MKTPKVKFAKANNRKKAIVIRTSKVEMFLPYSKLVFKPRTNNKIVKVFPDKEMHNEGITYYLEDGTKDFIHIDVFLHFNKNPEYMKEITLYELTIKLQKQREKLKIPISKLAHRLNTSKKQIDSLLDQTNYKKTMDSMLDLACALGVELEINCAA